MVVTNAFGLVWAISVELQRRGGLHNQFQNTASGGQCYAETGKLYSRNDVDVTSTTSPIFGSVLDTTLIW